MQCTLCSNSAYFYCADRKRDYYRCLSCDLVFADPAAQLTPADEKSIYDYHQNSPDDGRYRQFLSQLSEPLMAKLQPGMQGLDFGCGPGPTLNLMLEQQGVTVDLYDLYYYPEKSGLQPWYDFVTATEVVEHFSSPRASWQQLIQLLKPKGWLGVMTSLNTRQTTAEFKNWNYKNDPTHVSFYSPATIAWLSQQFRLEHHIMSDRVILFQRSGVSPEQLNGAW